MPEGHRRVLLLGASVRQSLSIAFQNAGFQAVGLNCSYEAIDVPAEQLASVVAEMHGDRAILGANVTIPHKEVVIPLLDALEASARAIGAVNTIGRDGSRLVGFNTDGAGFMAALAELGFHAAGTRAVVVGAGGAARAVVAALRPVADRIFIVNRTVERARQLCRDLGVDPGQALPWGDLDTVRATAYLVVNATPADLPPASVAASSQLEFDLRSRQSATGRLMLLHQGIAAFEIWTRQTAPADAMRAALMRAAEAAPA